MEAQNAEESVLQRTTWERPERTSAEQSKNLDKDLAHLLQDSKSETAASGASQEDNTQTPSKEPAHKVDLFLP